MKKYVLSFILFAFCLAVSSLNEATAQKKKKAPARSGTKRAATNKKTKGKKNVTVTGSDAVTDAVAAAAAAAAPAKANDSLPIPVIKKSQRPDAAVDASDLKDRTPLAYEHLRADDAMYRHKIWREIDTREKINQPFRFKLNEDNGNQTFIAILFKAIQDEAVTVFSGDDDRFTTPLTKADVAKNIAGESFTVQVYREDGSSVDSLVRRDVVLDSFYRFSIKEEVIFDKESSRLFWRILGIAPILNIYTAQANTFVGTKEIFWVYYPDLRPWLAKYETYNGKNYGARMSWEELFEGRMFNGRIVKTTMDNPYDKYFDQMPGLKDYPILQLLEGENIKEKIFNYEQDLWSY